MKTIRLLGEVNYDMYRELSEGLEEAEDAGESEVQLEFVTHGGDEDVGLAMYGRLLDTNLKTVAIGHGVVDSAATLPFMACKYRQCTIECSFMIHNSRVKLSGDMSDHRRLSQELEQAESLWYGRMAKHAQDVNKAGTLAELMLRFQEMSTKETRIRSNEAQTLGIVHRVVGEW